MGKQDTDDLIDRIGLVEAAKQRCVAGVLFTYRCSINCRHCCFGCAGDRPDVAMTARQCADALGMLHETGRVVHVAGGEAMLYWARLSEAVRVAHAEGNSPHFIETNCSFAVNEDVVRERLTFLAAHGLKGILASADPFHQEFVPPERFILVRRIAQEVFGARNFYGSHRPDAEIEHLQAIARDDALRRDYVRAYPPVIVGTAHAKLAQYLDGVAPQDPNLPTRGWRRGKAKGEKACRAEFAAETMWELHIDPYGNIQTNCGMILGSVARVRPARLLADGPENANRFVQAVAKEGALGLADLARREHGFMPPDQVTQTCELCYLARRFLRRFHPDVFGPAEVYM